MSLQEDIQPYLHPIWKVVGLTKDDPYFGPAIDNYHLYTAHYFNFGATEEDHRNYWRYINACAMKTNSGLTGLYWRFPNGPEPISQDEIIGMGFCCWKMKSQVFTPVILRYGNANFWSFNNTDPGKFTFATWLGRFLNLKPFLLSCTGQSVNIFRQVIWSLWCLASLFSTKQETSGKLLQYVQIPVMEKYWLCRQAGKIWRYFMKKQYGSPQSLFAIYFPNHPLAIYAPLEF